MSTTLRMPFEGNLGYVADQVEREPYTLDDLLAAVEEAIEEHGPDAIVLPYQTNNGRGANYGAFTGYACDLFTPDTEEA